MGSSQAPTPLPELLSWNDTPDHATPPSPYAKIVPGAQPAGTDFCWNIGGCNYNVCEFTDYAEWAWYWTPIMMVAAPYDGSASGTSSVQVSGQFSFGFDGSSVQSTTTQEVSNTISANSGQTEGYFQLDLWAAVLVENQGEHASFLSYYTPSPCTVTWVPLIDETTSQTYSYTLAAGQLATDVPSQPYFDGYYTVPDMNGIDYAAQSALYGDCGGNGLSQTVTNTNQATWTLGLEVSGDEVSGSISFQASTTTTAAYTYQFNNNAGNWQIDELNGNGGLRSWQYFTCGNPPTVWVNGVESPITVQSDSYNNYQAYGVPGDAVQIVYASSPSPGAATLFTCSTCVGTFGSNGYFNVYDQELYTDSGPFTFYVGVEDKTLGTWGNWVTVTIE